MTAPPPDPVHLGVVGDMVDASHAPPVASDSRVGGAPVLPGCGAPAGWARPACGVCGADMALVLQVRGFVCAGIGGAILLGAPS